jgi:hypothetical protein
MTVQSIWLEHIPSATDGLGVQAVEADESRVLDIFSTLWNLNWASNGRAAAWLVGSVSESRRDGRTRAQHRP